MEGTWGTGETIKRESARSRSALFKRAVLRDLRFLRLQSRSSRTMVKVSFKPPPGTAGATWPAICVGLFVAFGGVLFG